jgi:DNA-directed RNA polymerase
MLSGVVWTAIGDVVVAARNAMAWLRQVARLAAQRGVPLTWTTPSGFVAHQEYRDFKRREIQTRMRGKIVKLYDNDYDAGGLDIYRQGLGISPNFVHSLDASAMMLTIRLALAAGVTQFAMIHDSYGTVAPDVDKLAKALRQAFVDMYENHNVLQDFADDVLRLCPGLELPPLPPFGSLDIRQVQESHYFFA